MAEPASSSPRLSELAGPHLRPADAPWLEGLNPAQREAVEALDGPVLVLAGAGTGKTRALTTRIAQILGTGRAQPWQILAVTFTNKAAREMQRRVEALVQPLMGRGATEGIWLGTFHALAARILRSHAELVGLKPNFTILDPDDQIRLIKQLLEADNVDTKKWPARILHAIIERWKDKGLRPDQVNPADVGDFAGGRALAVYTAYQERLRTLNAVDFGDLLLHNLTLFTRHPDVLEKYQRRFRYILVDEYQDTNVAQYLWLRLLAQREKNICCVGDDDQSIYGWRGAEVGNILKFEQDFPGARIIRLEQNYRSTPPILAAASHLIAHNEGRLGKTLWTDADGGEKIRLRGIWDGEEEARIIGELVEDLHRKGHPLSEIAILVRASFQTREFEERFITLGVPYRVVGGPRFYERLEIRDAVAYLRLIHSPDDDLAFERIVNKPKRGLGDAAVQALHRLARDQGVPMAEAARLLAGSDDLRPQARNALGKFVEMLDRWRAYAETASHVEVAETVLDESGYTEMWQKEKSPDAPGRLENLKELVRALEEFDNLGGFLEHISLVMETNENARGDMVNIMTLHSAKGLEFDTVFLPGWEEGVFPHQRALDENGQAGLEEERRLAYVGLTRARQAVHVSFAANRRIHNQWQSVIPSRFIDELPAAQVEVATEQGLYGGGGRRGFSESVSSWNDDWNESRWSRGPARRPGATQRHGATRPRVRTIEGTAERIDRGPKEARFRKGERVFHQKFGYGVIRAVDGDKLAVLFEHSGEKNVMDSFVEKA
jgi:DNA helicase-2/ATP-dependent DNA helicase PcrA